MSGAAEAGFAVKTANSIVDAIAKIFRVNREILAMRLLPCFRKISIYRDKENYSINMTKDLHALEFSMVISSCRYLFPSESVIISGFPVRRARPAKPSAEEANPAGFLG
ncbi:hypothetical protein [Frankia sp. R43]|uniref:hypothetical protein n=1 Tax=Frankia sp. R43 TaxID=269536 RepID=UPI000A40410C|nr:hypothetical protein [Frankia sp. R43]